LSRKQQLTVKINLLRNVTQGLGYKEIGCEGVDWIQLAEDEIHVWAHEHSNEPPRSIKGMEFLTS
jgi:hypothetical protein